MASRVAARRKVPTSHPPPHLPRWTGPAVSLVVGKLTHPARRPGHPLQGSWLRAAAASPTEAAVCDAVAAAVALGVPDVAQAASAANVKAAAPVVASAAAVAAAAAVGSPISDGIAVLAS